MTRDTFSDIVFEPACRSATPIIVAIAGPTGGGKTYTALEIAMGLGGKPVVISTEGRRDLYYADLPEFAGKFDRVGMQPPYSPDRCLQHMQAAVARGYATIIFDSFSDEYIGEGGLCDMAEAEADRVRNEAAKWAKPKAAHKLVIRWMRNSCPAHLIFCLRAEEKVRLEKQIDERTGREKTVVVPIGFQPICEKAFMFDMVESFLLTPEGGRGVPQWIKPFEGHKLFFPEGKPVTRAAGVALARWAAGEPQEERKGPGPDHALIAESIAREGSVSFRAWWKTQPKITRDELRDSLLGLQGIAAVADRKNSSAANPPTASEGVERSDGLRSGAAEDSLLPGNQADPRTDAEAVEEPVDDSLPPRLAEIDAKLRTTAEGGMTPFNKMWLKLPDETKATLRSRRPEYEAIATAAIGGMGE